jgi:hypothetical protein
MAAGALIPLDGLLRLEFSLVPQQTRRMGSSGQSVIVQTGPSLWRLTVETRRLSMLEARTWSTWLSDRIHRGETFTAFNLFRNQPAGALGTADGSIGLNVDIPNSELDLTGCGAYVASPGDAISYRTANNGYYFGEIREAATAVSGAVSVKVNPTPVAKHATTPAVRRVRALAEFELTTDPGPFEDYSGRALAFEAAQVLR